jgi:hypothetical protein
MLGMKAARAASYERSLAASWCSASAMSGRRRSSVDGSSGGMTGVKSWASGSPRSIASVM